MFSIIEADIIEKNTFLPFGTNMTDAGDRPNPNPIYHEKQCLRFCLVHALNNLFQEPFFTKSNLDEICMNLTDSNWFNPHRSWIGIGNYDVNVLMGAVSLKDCYVAWLDLRKDVTSINVSSVTGFIVNVESSTYMGIVPVPFMKGRHWFSVARFGPEGHYFDLDSKLPEPKLIGTAERLMDFLRQIVSETKKSPQIFLIVPKLVDESSLFSPQGSTQLLSDV